MRILGIDPGYGIVGFGLIELKGLDWTMVDCGVIETEAGLEFPQRLEQIYEDLKLLVKEFKPDLVAIEEIFFMQNVSTGIEVSEARGVILLALTQAGLPIYEYAPNEVKASITGYGQADKIQMQNMVQTYLNLSRRPQPDDAADALAIALTCGFQVVQV